MKLYAFPGIHFTGSASEVGRLAAPPYDQIDDALRDQLQASDPHHFCHLSCPVARREPGPYLEAARLHEEWLQDGTLERDSEPALYPYVIELAGGGRRLGVLAKVGIEPEGSLDIQAHERTVAKPLADRLSLLRATRIDLEPILLLSEDKGAIDRLLEEDIATATAVVEHDDELGNRHLLYRLADPQRITLYREAVANARGLIADGHHRYKVASIFADEIGAKPGSAAASKLAVVTSLASPGLSIGPIHRALSSRPDLAAMATLILARTPWRGGSGVDFAEAVASAPQPALGIWQCNGEPEIWRLDPGQGPAELPAAASELAVVLLHFTLLPAIGIALEGATDGTVVYRKDPNKLWNELQDETLGVGFWMPPMSTSGFAGAVAEGDLLPPKSTRFLPKVASGLVWTDHRGPLV